MTNEIKEIERILAKSRKYITFLQRGYILNYIFDLQEDERYFYGQYKDLQQRIDKANSILNKLVIMKPWENTDNPMRKIYRPIKNTTKQEVYRAIVELENILRGDE